MKTVTLQRNVLSLFASSHDTFVRIESRRQGHATTTAVISYRMVVRRRELGGVQLTTIEIIHKP